MKVLVVGTGSIGKRHIGNLLELGAEVQAFSYRPDAQTLDPRVTRVPDLAAALASDVDAVVVANRTVERAQALVQSHAPLAALQKTELSAHSPQALEHDFDLIINATASSLAGAEVPVPARVLRPGSLAYDMMYGPAAQGFLDWARQHGAVPRDGLGMLVEQAAEAFLLWRGVRPPSAQVLQEMQQANSSK